MQDGNTREIYVAGGDGMMMLVEKAGPDKTIRILKRSAQFVMLDRDVTVDQHHCEGQSVGYEWRRCLLHVMAPSVKSFRREDYPLIWGTILSEVDETLRQHERVVRTIAGELERFGSLNVCSCCSLSLAVAASAGVQPFSTVIFRSFAQIAACSLFV